MPDIGHGARELRYGRRVSVRSQSGLPDVNANKCRVVRKRLTLHAWHLGHPTAGGLIRSTPAVQGPVPPASCISGSKRTKSAGYTDCTESSTPTSTDDATLFDSDFF